MRNEEGSSRRRPIGVWVISVYYVLSAGFTLLSLALVLSGAIKLPAAQEAYWASLTATDHLITVAIAVSILTGAVCLFLLRRIAVTMFSISLALNVALTVHILRTNLVEAMGVTPLGLVFGWFILIAVIGYAHKLAKDGVLC